MSDPVQRPSEALLHAYVDNQIEDAQRREVEQFLAEHPGESLRLESYRKQNEALQALRQLPDARTFTMPEFSSRRRWDRVALWVAAAILLVTVGTGNGWWLRGKIAPPEPTWMRLVQQAELAHKTYVPEVVHPVEVASGREPHLQTWLSRRLGTAISIPVLTEHGFDFVGGRLLPASPGPAAQFMYQDVSGNRLTMYVRAAPADRKERSFRNVQSGSLWICYWMGQSIDFALTGEFSREDLVSIAKTAYLQIANITDSSSADW